MSYQRFQQKIYENKINREFNTTDVQKEIILMTEEFGELCDAYIVNNKVEITDAVGDLMIYCIGLSAMFGWNSDKIYNPNIKLPKNPSSIKTYIPFIGRELGMIAKTYKKSNKQKVKLINKLDEFKLHTGNLMGYCSHIFKFININEDSILEKIVTNNKIRTHQGKI